MTDRELLELAARAAGLSLSHCDDAVWDYERGDYVGWNPLADDGDALRLAVALRIDLHMGKFHTRAVVGDVFVREDAAHNRDAYAATRRAIVRAAAEIGRTM